MTPHERDQVLLLLLVLTLCVVLGALLPGCERVSMHEYCEAYRAKCASVRDLMLRDPTLAHDCVQLIIECDAYEQGEQGT